MKNISKKKIMLLRVGFERIHKRILKILVRYEKGIVCALYLHARF